MQTHKHFIPCVVNVEIETNDPERIEEHLKKVKQRIDSSLIYYETKNLDRVKARFERHFKK